MASDLSAILGFSTLTGLVRVHFDQSKNRGLSREVFSRKRTITGKEAKWYQVQASRERAPFNGRMGTPIKLENLDVKEKSASPASIVVSKSIMGEELFREGWPSEGNTQGDGLQLLPNAQQRVSDELEDLINQVTCSVEWACARSLEGTITINPTTVPGSKTSSVVTFDEVLSLAAGGAYWSNTATKILTDDTSGKPSLFNARRKMADEGGIVLGRVMHNGLVSNYLKRNDEIQKTVRGSIPNAPVQPNLALINQSIGDERAKFIEYDGMYTVSGTATRFLTDTYAFGLPEGNEYFELHEGYAVVPTGGGVIGTSGMGESLMKLATPGIAAYAVLNMKPPVGVEIFVIYHFLPVLRYGKAVLRMAINSA